MSIIICKYMVFQKNLQNSLKFGSPNKLIKAISLTVAIFTSLAYSASALAGTVMVSDTKILQIEFYGAQMTLYLEKAHNLNGCGSGKAYAVAFDSSTMPEAQIATLLSVWTSGKTINISVTDDVCNGDRPTNSGAYIKALN